MASTAPAPRLGLDKWTFEALLQPALFALLPLFVVIAVWLSGTWTALTGLGSLIVGAGGVVVLANVARYLGRRADERLGDRVGPAHSARILSHADRTLPSGSKQRYHEYLRRHGHAIPTAEEEAAEPASALDKYLSALAWLREKTRANASETLLLNENIAYGFRRSMLGLRPLALVVLALSIAIDLYFTFRDRAASEATIGMGLVIAGFCIAVAALWILLIRPAFLEDASKNYALRLLAQTDVDSLPQASTP